MNHETPGVQRRGDASGREEQEVVSSWQSPFLWSLRGMKRTQMPARMLNRPNRSNIVASDAPPDGRLISPILLAAGVKRYSATLL